MLCSQLLMANLTATITFIEGGFIFHKMLISNVCTKRKINVNFLSSRPTR